ncbi:MAG: hypothetical protein ACK5Y8_11585 [Betaproteobacteria bacterium]|nr:serine hydrolase [Rubrivivax sp.]
MAAAMLGCTSNRDGGRLAALPAGVFGAELCAASILQELQAPWRRIFFSLQYGTGVMRFDLPWVLSPSRRLPAWIGHSGASGAYMFWRPQTQVHLAGTVNQTRQRPQSFRLMLQAHALFQRLAAAPARA